MFSNSVTFIIIVLLYNICSIFHLHFLYHYFILLYSVYYFVHTYFSYYFNISVMFSISFNPLYSLTLCILCARYTIQVCVYNYSIIHCMFIIWSIRICVAQYFKLYFMFSTSFILLPVFWVGVYSQYFVQFPFYYYYIAYFMYIISVTLYYLIVLMYIICYIYISLLVIVDIALFYHICSVCSSFSFSHYFIWYFMFIISSVIFCSLLYRFLKLWLLCSYLLAHYVMW